MAHLLLLVFSLMAPQTNNRMSSVPSKIIGNPTKAPPSSPSFTTELEGLKFSLKQGLMSRSDFNSAVIALKEANSGLVKGKNAPTHSKVPHKAGATKPKLLKGKKAHSHSIPHHKAGTTKPKLKHASSFKLKVKSHFSPQPKSSNPSRTIAPTALPSAHLHSVAPTGSLDMISKFLRTAPRATPTTTPKAAPKVTPKVTPKATPKATPKTIPKATPKAAPKAKLKDKQQAKPKVKQQARQKARPKARPKAAPKDTPTAKPKVAPNTKPKATPTATPPVQQTVTQTPIQAHLGNQATNFPQRKLPLDPEK